LSDQIVVTFRMAHAGVVPSTGRGFLERARVLIQRAEAHGGKLVGWGAVSLSCAWSPDAADDVVMLVSHMATDGTTNGEIGWAIGVAQGKLEPVAQDGPRATLMWGIALVSSVSQSQIARPGEVLVDPSLRALASGELITLGFRVARDKGKRVRGARLDVRQPFRREAAEQASRMREPVLVATGDEQSGLVEPSSLLWMPGALAILRADPGAGGTRMLAELSHLVVPGRSLLITPAGSGMQPLGALRRAMARATSVEVNPFLLELAPALERLVSGEGIPIDTAAHLVAAFLWRRNTAAPPGALLIDDASEVDAASLEACARAVSVSERAFAVVARLDATSAPPSELSSLPKGPEVELKPLGSSRAEALAAACTDGALDPEARKRWARLGCYTPLGILEAIACSLEAGDLAWVGDSAFPRRRSSGKGKMAPARHWIQQRVAMLPDDQRVALGAIALLGGEARLSHVVAVLEALGRKVDVASLASDLARNRWLAAPQKGWVALPTRTHREALADVLDEPTKLALHRALADIFTREESGLGHAETAFHASRAGDGPRASRLALQAARAAASSKLEQWATKLIAFARKEDPECEDEAQRALESSIPVAPNPSAFPRVGVVERDVAVAPARPASEVPSAEIENAPPSRTLVDENPSAQPVSPPRAEESEPSSGPTQVDSPGSPSTEDQRKAPAAAPAGQERAAVEETAEWEHAADSEPPTVANEIKAPMAPVPPSLGAQPSTARDAAAPPMSSSPTSESVVLRLTTLAREALMSSDFSALERWVDGLKASGEHGAFADRMRAMARLSRGDVGDALRVLRRSRAALPPSALGARCQASLALGVALAVAGRPQDALLEGLDALARARENKDDKGASACLAFLARLYTAMSRDEEAARLRNAQA
jgi:hypothetical protein